MSEDELAQMIMEETYSNYEYYTEVHYNHYGTRGVVDLVEVIQWSGPGCDPSAIELKSDAAIDQSTGANEILRQFNKQISYFSKGVADNRVPTNGLHHKLVFEATEKTITHVVENISLYANPKQDGIIKIHPPEAVEDGGPYPAPVSHGKIQMSEYTEWLADYVDPSIDAVNDTRGDNDE